MKIAFTLIKSKEHVRHGPNVKTVINESKGLKLIYINPPNVDNPGVGMYEYKQIPLMMGYFFFNYRICKANLPKQHGFCAIQPFIPKGERAKTTKGQDEGEQEIAKELNLDGHDDDDDDENDVASSQLLFFDIEAVCTYLTPILIHTPWLFLYQSLISTGHQ